MTKFLLFFLSLTLFTLTTSSAAIYKGQRVFVKRCLKCHGSGQVFVASYTMKEWKKLMVEDGKPLADLHLSSKKASKSHSYFKSKKYTKKEKHLEQFLVEYAKDSGNIPACN